MQRTTNQDVSVVPDNIFTLKDLCDEKADH